MFALVGMSLVLVYRTTGIVNFAQGVFVVLGGLFTFRLSDDMPLAVATLVSVGIAAFLVVDSRGRGGGLSRKDDEPRQHHHHPRGRVSRGGAAPARVRRHPAQLSGISDHAWNIQGVLVQPQYVLIAGVALLCAVALTLFLRRTIVGQALVACSDSRRAAELVGLNMRSLAVVAFVGAGLSARSAGRCSRRAAR